MFLLLQEVIQNIQFFNKRKQIDGKQSKTNYISPNNRLVVKPHPHVLWGNYCMATPYYYYFFFLQSTHRFYGTNHFAR